MVTFVNYKVFSIAVIASGLGACSTLPNPLENIGAPKQQGEVVVTQVPAEGQIPAQKLAAGECGLFVWGAGPEKPFILFSKSGTEKAEWAAPGGNTTLEVTFETQTGTDREIRMSKVDGNVVTLELSDMLARPAGMSYRKGQLFHETDEGWSRTVPVVALDSCQSAAIPES